MNIPTKWGKQLSGTQIERQAIGESRADVFRIRSSNGQDLFLKSEVVGLLNELPDEVERLRWLRQLDLPGPSVLDATLENNVTGCL